MNPTVNHEDYLKCGFSTTAVKVQAHLKIFKPIVYFILLLFSLAFVREDCAQFCPTLSRPCGL